MTVVETGPVDTVDIAAATTVHLRWLESLEQAFEQIVMRSLKRAMRPVAAKLGDAVTAAGATPDPEPTPPPGADAFVSVDDLAQIRTLWAEQVATELLPLVGDVFASGAQGVSMAVAGVSQVAPEVLSVGAQEWLAVSQNRLTRVGDEAWENARTQLLEGVQAGESIPQLSKRLRQSLDITSARAKTVARTEVIGAANAGQYAEAQARGLATKTWLNTHDARTRPTHVAAGEQVRPIDEPFIVGGHQLRFPHDPFGPPQETINCRCTMLFDEGPLCACTPGWVKKELGGSLVSAGSLTDCGCSDDLGETPFVPKKFETKSGAFSKNQAFNFGDKGWAEWRKSLSGSEINSLKAYTSGGYDPIGAHLRGLPVMGTKGTSRKMSTAEIEKNVRQLDKAFARKNAIAPEDVETYRGVRGSFGKELNRWFDEGKLINPGVPGKPPGALLTDRSFVSTSLDQAAARHFMTGVPADEKVFLTIQVKQGQRAVFPGEDYGIKSELEMILPRGTQLRFVAGERINGVLHLTAMVES